MNKDFYDRCAAILGIPHEYNEPTNFKRSRWNNRQPGNGRFPGFGTIQCFGSGVRIMQKGKGTRIFNDYETVFTYLEDTL